VEKSDITPELAARLVAEQFPDWADLPVTPVELNGWDNTTFRLGRAMSIRLPSHDRYVPQIEKEHQWLPVLAPHLPLPIPEPLARGEPSPAFARPWSIYRWLDGHTATMNRVSDLERFAVDLGEFLSALYRIDPAGGPPAGEHSFHRGGPVGTWNQQTRAAIEALARQIDSTEATNVWEAAVSAPWDGAATWVHGDVTGSNLLVKDGRLSAVLDFGCCAVGDLACDLTVAWTFFVDASRETFRRTVVVDEGTWARARGWALWKALVTVHRAQATGQAPELADARFGWRTSPMTVIQQLIDDRDLSGAP